MTKWALIVNDTVDAIYEYDATGEISGLQAIPDDVYYGFIRDGGGWKAPPPVVVPPPVPEELSRWQFFAAAAMAEIITEEEAEAAITGPLPPPFVAFIATLPENQRFAATMLLKGNQVFHRHHPFVEAFLAAQTPPMSSEKADSIWRVGAALA